MNLTLSIDWDAVGAAADSLGDAISETGTAVKNGALFLGGSVLSGTAKTFDYFTSRIDVVEQSLAGGWQQGLDDGFCMVEKL